MLEAGGFPVALGNVPYDLNATQLIGKIAHHWSPRDP